jgi:hypothetical protein
MLQNLHAESCVDSLTLWYEFMVHNSMTIEEDNQHDFDFQFAFPCPFQSWRILMFPSFALQFQLNVILINPRFIICDDRLQECIPISISTTVEKGSQTMTDTLITASHQSGPASTEGQLNTKE